MIKIWLYFCGCNTTYDIRPYVILTYCSQYYGFKGKGSGIEESEVQKSHGIMNKIQIKVILRDAHVIQVSQSEIFPLTVIGYLIHRISQCQKKLHIVSSTTILYTKGCATGGWSSAGNHKHSYYWAPQAELMLSLLAKIFQNYLSPRHSPRRFSCLR